MPNTVWSTFIKMGATIPVCHSKGTVPKQPRQPQNVLSLQHLRSQSCPPLTPCHWGASWHFSDLCQWYGWVFTWVFRLCLCFRGHRFRSSWKCSFPPPHPTLSPVQVSNSPPLLSTAWPTAPISLHESSDGLLEHPWGRLKDLFYSCPKLLSHPSFCFSNHQSCNPFGLLVPLCPLRRTLGQPSQDGLLLQFVSLLSLPPRQAPLTFWQQLPLQWKLWTWHIQILCPQPVKPGVSAAQKTYRYRALM